MICKFFSISRALLSSTIFMFTGSLRELKKHKILYIGVCNLCCCYYFIFQWKIQYYGESLIKPESRSFLLVLNCGQYCWIVPLSFWYVFLFCSLFFPYLIFSFLSFLLSVFVFFNLPFFLSFPLILIVYSFIQSKSIL